MNQYLDQLSDIQERYKRELDELADELRYRIVMPVCKKHKLTYIAGNGTFFFTDSKDENYHNTWEIADPKLAEELSSVFDILNTEVGYNDYLGFYVRDVMEEDYK